MYWGEFLLVLRGTHAGVGSSYYKSIVPYNDEKWNIKMKTEYIINRLQSHFDIVEILLTG